MEAYWTRLRLILQVPISMGSGTVKDHGGGNELYKVILQGAQKDQGETHLRVESTPPTCFGPTNGSDERCPAKKGGTRRNIHLR